jgi:hypothetical protein
MVKFRGDVPEDETAGNGIGEMTKVAYYAIIQPSSLTLAR